MFPFVDQQIDEMRQKLHEKWETIKDTVHASGSKDKLNGPTHAFAILLDLIEMHPDRFLAGTDFVASMGDPFEFPGLKPYKMTPTGCNKDPANHRRQVTDTSAINIFFSDTVFRKVVLGANYFKVTGLASQFVAPKVCETEEGRDTKDTSKAHSLQMPHVLLVLLLSRFGFDLF